jgi:methyl-accepting chemotaxis protein
MGEVVKIFSGKVMDNRTDRYLTFEPLIRRIEVLNRTTEEDFLIIGMDLQEVSRRSGEISKNALAASAIMSGDEINGSIKGLEEMIRQLEEVFIRTDETSTRNMGSLHGIADALRSVRNELTDLKETSRDLKMLALSTKIQSTRTGDNSSAFMQLGQDIKGMSEVISSKSSDLMGETASLGDLVCKVQQNLNELKARHQNQTQSVVKGAWTIIEGLNFLSAKSGEEVERINRSSKAITGSIDELVVSVQYQDITRQSLEKVMGELRNAQEGGLSEYFNDEDNGNGVTLPCDDILLVGVCKKQSKCLMDTGENISSAVRNMLNGLEAVIRNIEDMATVTGKASEESSRFLEELEKGMSSVTDFLSAVAESGKEMSGAMNSLANTVDGMAEFTGDIEMISSEVELIALNARVMAAQKGSTGAGMSVIAEAVQKTAHNSENKRMTLISILEGVSRSSMELKGQIDRDSTGDDTRFDHLVRELGVFLDALRIMQRKIVSMLDDIDLKSRDLHEKISNTAEKIKVHEKVQSDVMEITRELEKTAEDLCGSICSEDLHQIVGEKFDTDILDSLGPSQVMALIKDHFLETDFLQCFEEERMTSGEDDFVLF